MEIVDGDGGEECVTLKDLVLFSELMALRSQGFLTRFPRT
jgi:hypothetical protein